VDLNMVLEQKNNTGTTWRFYAQSEDDSDLNRVLGNGTVNFDTSGRFLSADNTGMTINREGTGALSPQQFTVAFNEPVDSTSALANSTSQLAATQKDGNAIGTLSNFNVSTDGTVVGVFSNGLTRDLGKVVLATFSNQDGLVEVSGNMFGATASSGDAALVIPGNSAGNVIGQALELSNVDLSQEFINLITATTGFSANSRVFTTSDRLIQELLSSLR